jgi:hypothetical protein
LQDGGILIDSVVFAVETMPEISQEIGLYACKPRTLRDARIEELEMHKHLVSAAPSSQPEQG